MLCWLSETSGNSAYWPTRPRLMMSVRTHVRTFALKTKQKRVKTQRSGPGRSLHSLNLSNIIVTIHCSLTEIISKKIDIEIVYIWRIKACTMRCVIIQRVSKVRKFYQPFDDQMSGSKILCINSHDGYAFEKFAMVEKKITVVREYANYLNIAILYLNLYLYLKGTIKSSYRNTLC